MRILGNGVRTDILVEVIKGKDFPYVIKRSNYFKRVKKIVEKGYVKVQDNWDDGRKSDIYIKAEGLNRISQIMKQYPGKSRKYEIEIKRYTKEFVDEEIEMSKKALIDSNRSLKL